MLSYKVQQQLEIAIETRIAANAAHERGDVRLANNVAEHAEALFCDAVRMVEEERAGRAAVQFPVLESATYVAPK